MWFRFRWGRRIAAILCALCLAAAMIGCGGEGGAPAQPSEGGALPSPEPSPDPLPAPSPDSQPSPDPSPAPEPGPVTSGAPTYPSETPPGPARDESYFADALFLGDSRLRGLLDETGIAVAADYAYVAVSVSSVFTKNLVGGRTIADDLRARRPAFAKAYLCFGLNELGWPYQSEFASAYAKVIALLRELNPDAVIYLLNIYPVTAAHSQEQAARGLFETNENIRVFNETIAQLALDNRCHLLNAAAAVCDESGALPEGMSPDGVHASAALCRTLLRYLMEHTIA